MSFYHSITKAQNGRDGAALVVQVVFHRGAAFCAGAAETATAVPGILVAWIGELQAFQALQALHSDLQAALQQRTGIISPLGPPADALVRPLCPSV